MYASNMWTNIHHKQLCPRAHLPHPLPIPFSSPLHPYQWSRASAAPETEKGKSFWEVELMSPDKSKQNESWRFISDLQGRGLPREQHANSLCGENQWKGLGRLFCEQSKIKCLCIWRKTNRDKIYGTQRVKAHSYMSLSIFSPSFMGFQNFPSHIYILVGLSCHKYLVIFVFFLCLFKRFWALSFFILIEIKYIQNKEQTFSGHKWTVTNGHHCDENTEYFKFSRRLPRALFCP